MFRFFPQAPLGLNVKNKPAVWLRVDLIGLEMVTAEAISESQSRARLHRSSLLGFAGRKVAARAQRASTLNHRLSAIWDSRLSAVRQVA
jgi:hypothetical protein